MRKRGEVARGFPSRVAFGLADGAALFEALAVDAGRSHREGRSRPSDSSPA
jgi:hypothetical protein